MAKYEVTLKASVTITVEADNEDAARSDAEHFVETACSQSENYVAGWNTSTERSQIVRAGEVTVIDVTDIALDD